MRTLQEFKEFCKSELSAELYALEVERETFIKRLLPMGVPLLVLGIVGSVWISLRIGDLLENWQMATLPLWAALAVCGLLAYLLSRNYRLNFKQRVILKTVKFVNPDLLFDVHGCIPLLSFIDSNLFRRIPNSYRGEDLVYGKVGSTEIKFCEIHASVRTSLVRTLITRTYKIPIFDGLFFVADFNKNFSGRVVILPDIAQQWLGRLGQSLQSLNKPRGELIKLEDPEFEKYFVAYGDDQVQARYVLSTSLVKRISDFRSKYKGMTYLSFVNSKVYIAMPAIGNLFEARLFGTLLDFQVVKRHFQSLQLAVGIVEDLNLNTRIWTKE